MASTIAHDAHNIVVVGIDDDDIARAAPGGAAALAGGAAVGGAYEEVVRETEACVAAVRELGCTFPSPFQMMAFLALGVIPKRRSPIGASSMWIDFELLPLVAD